MISPEVAKTILDICLTILLLFSFAGMILGAFMIVKGLLR